MQLQLLQRILRLTIQHSGGLAFAKALQQQAACGEVEKRQAWRQRGLEALVMLGGMKGLASYLLFNKSSCRRAGAAAVNLPTRDAVTDGSTGSPGATAALLSPSSAATPLLERASVNPPVMGRPR